MSQKLKAKEIVNEELSAIYGTSKDIITDLVELVNKKQEEIEELKAKYDIAIERIIKLQS
jgi:hypothetical protein